MKRSAKPTLIALLLCTALVLPAVGAQASTIQPPPPLPPTVVQAAGVTHLQLLGYGRFRKLLWDVFDASLWVPGDRWSPNQTFVLELRYARDVKGADIVDGTRDQWKHLGYDDQARLTEWLAQLSAIFPDVKKGDQLAGVYLPGRETRFFHNGEPIGEIKDPEFGRHFFAIWLDEKTSQPALRADLLGHGCAKPTTVAQAEVQPCGGATMPTPSTHRPDSDPS
ncbi:MAG TPA: chalcone isomerase family protein [Nevskiales bacterium]|nr:chalcone isomerase family protein [Nevskiales bacterium]